MFISSWNKEPQTTALQLILLANLREKIEHILGPVQGRFVLNP